MQFIKYRISYVKVSWYMNIFQNNLIKKLLSYNNRNLKFVDLNM